ncbi:MAG: phosphatidate cytidylyltransferase [Spirochaetales bacterium]|nr:phosphatidate cytidylyltransferase [Spirochaetales bacterium]
MKNVYKRVSLFLVALPALAGIILFLPQGHYAAVNCLAILVMGIGALEAGGIFRHQGVFVSRPVTFILGAAPPALCYISLWEIIPARYPVYFYIFAAIFLLAREIFHKNEEDFRQCLPRLGAYFFILLYPGLFGIYIIRLTELPHAGIVFMIFVAATYLNDSLAWLTGVLWGENTKNILAVSPNKSLVGFIGGFLASILVTMVCAAVWHEYFPLSLPGAALLGTALGISTILGDLAESVLKRSGGVKDSGNLIPGRGGLLDSIDSPLFNAPVFFYLFTFLSGGSPL